MRVRLTSAARKDLLALSPHIAERIGEKLLWYANQEHPLDFAQPLKGRISQYRFRIGDYRAIFTIENGVIHVIVVMSVRHRKDAYR